MRTRAGLVPLLALLGTVLAAYLGLGLLEASRTGPEGGGSPGPRRRILLSASRDMGRALAALGEEARRRAYLPDPGLDPNNTGIIGIEWSGLTTTLGSLPAKRSAAQPDAAALLALLLLEAGVGPGDLVAVESSASFPGFAIAALVASHSLGARAVAVVSVGSSTYGANRPDFSLPDILLFLQRQGLIEAELLGLSPGGADDQGRDLDPGLLEAVLARAARGGIPILGPARLDEDVERKKAILESRGRPKVLVSIGGNWAAAGPGQGLMGRTGLLRARDFPAPGPGGRGLIQAFLREGLPVVRILDVQDLCVRYGLAYDPRPWPPEASSGLYAPRGGGRLLCLLGPLLGLGLALGLKRLRSRRAALPGPGDGCPPA